MFYEIDSFLGAGVAACGVFERAGFDAAANVCFFTADHRATCCFYADCLEGL